MHNITFYQLTCESVKENNTTPQHCLLHGGIQVGIQLCKVRFLLFTCKRDQCHLLAKTMDDTSMKVVYLQNCCFSIRSIYVFY